MAARRASILGGLVHKEQSLHAFIAIERTLMGKPGTPAALEKARSRRTPFTEIRDGRLLRQLRFAFTVSRGKP